MSLVGREPPVSGFLFGISLMVRIWSETHRSLREQRYSLVLWHTVKFGQNRSFPVLQSDYRARPKISPRANKSDGPQTEGRRSMRAGHVIN